MDIKDLAIKAHLKAGIDIWIYNPEATGGQITSFMSVFANLVLEEAAKKCEEGIDNTGNWDSDYWNQACENRAIAIREMKSKE